MHPRLLEWKQKNDALSLRERGLLFAIVAAVVFMLVQLLAIDPVLKQRQTLKAQRDALHNDIRQINAQRQMLEAQLSAGVNRAQARHRDKLQEQIETLEERLETSVVGIIPPQMMARVLENVLAQNTELRLLNIENLPVEAIVTEDEPGNDAPAPQRGLYRHGFTLQLRGNYPAAIRYFEQLAALPWRFYWDSLHYEVDSYPNAIITVEVYTVSLAQEWISV